MSATPAAWRKAKVFSPPRAKTVLRVPPAPEHKVDYAAARTPVGAAGKGPIRQLPDDAAEFVDVLSSKFFSPSVFVAPCSFFYQERKK